MSETHTDFSGEIAAKGYFNVIYSSDLGNWTITRPSAVEYVGVPRRFEISKSQLVLKKAPGVDYFFLHRCKKNCGPMYNVWDRVMWRQHLWLDLGY